jgi:hypothetical protein
MDGVDIIDPVDLAHRIIATPPGTRITLGLVRWEAWNPPRIVEKTVTLTVERPPGFNMPETSDGSNGSLIARATGSTDETTLYDCSNEASVPDEYTPIMTVARVFQLAFTVPGNLRPCHTVLKSNPKVLASQEPAAAIGGSEFIEHILGPKKCYYVMLLNTPEANRIYANSTPTDPPLKQISCLMTCLRSIRLGLTLLVHA